MRRATLVAAGMVLIALAACSAPPAPDPAPPAVDPWPIDGAVMRPDAMFVDPVRARPGEVVAVSYAEAWDRGILYAMDAELENDWERRFLLISDANGGRPTWFALGDESVVVEAIGIGGSGPDRVLVPEVLEPGNYRICTANAGNNICTTIRIQPGADA